jgi:hypothetical protein
MKFSEVVAQTIAWLQRDERVSYRALKREFELDDEFLADVKAELIEIKQLAVDQDGKMLVWTGKDSLESSVQSPELKTLPPPEARRRPHAAASFGRTHSYRNKQREARAQRTGSARRSALFADLKGSTALIEGLDLEEGVGDPALQLMMDAVHQYEGLCGPALGGIFALFQGAAGRRSSPTALYAALRTSYAPLWLAARRGRAPLVASRMNTGESCCAPFAKMTCMTTPCQSGIRPIWRRAWNSWPIGAIVVPRARTAQLMATLPSRIWDRQIKGVEEALNIYEVLGALRTRLQVTATRRGLTRFVGRRVRWSNSQGARTSESWPRTNRRRDGGGAGQSRLFYEFKLLCWALSSAGSVLRVARQSDGVLAGH